MKKLFSALCAALVAGPLVAQVIPANPSASLRWDAESRDYSARDGETSAPFTFSVTNISGADVTIQSIRTSCGCTTAQSPTLPCRLAPGSNATVQVSLDLRGKQGQLTKTVTVESTAGLQTLIVRATAPAGTKAN